MCVFGCVLKRTIYIFVFVRQQPSAVYPRPGWWSRRLRWGWQWRRPWPLLSLHRVGPSLESYKLQHQECCLWQSCPVEGLVPSLLPWENHPDAWEVREERNVWHARSAVARRRSPPGARRSGHPQSVWKLERQLLFVQIPSHSSQSMSGKLLRLQVCQTGSLSFGILCR